MDDLSDLDAILTREVQHKDKRAELTSVRKEPPSPAQAARILVLEEALDWHPVSQHILLMTHNCECGTSSSFSTGLMVCQRHRRDPSAVRWVRVTRKRDLPFGRALEESVTVPACFYCHPFDAIEQMEFSPFPDVLGAYNGTPKTPSSDGDQAHLRQHPAGPSEPAPLQSRDREGPTWGLLPVLREPLARVLLSAAGRLSPQPGV